MATASRSLCKGPKPSGEFPLNIGEQLLGSDHAAHDTLPDPVQRVSALRQLSPQKIIKRSTVFDV
ncbi:MAG: hypothetical protein B7Z83_03560, partial [Thiomonas sp. 20-64-5]